MTMASSLQRYYLALGLLPGMHPALAEKLKVRLGSIDALFQASKSALVSLTLPSPLIAAILSTDWRRIDQLQQWLAMPQQHVYFWCEPEYPARLLEVYRPPLMVFVRGDAGLLSMPQLAIVGSRKPTPRGVGSAMQLARELALCDLVITSGLALGIDRAAHEGALSISGKTLAVLAHGLDQVYPKSHRDLAEQIMAAGGALVSEHPLGTQPLPAYFPQRNRIISGLSLGVLVAEAAVKSGSLITAKLAAEQGREVFAVPGDIRNPVSSGCHYLIQNGAKLTTCVDDVLHELPLTTVKPARDAPPKAGDTLTTALSSLLALFGNRLLSASAVADESGLAFDQVCSILLQLEMQGYLVSVAGGYRRTMKEPG